MVYFGRVDFLSKQSLWVGNKYIGLTAGLFSESRVDIDGVKKFLLVWVFESKHKLLLERQNFFHRTGCFRWCSVFS